MPPVKGSNQATVGVTKVAVAVSSCDDLDAATCSRLWSARTETLIRILVIHSNVNWMSREVRGSPSLQSDAFLELNVTVERSSRHPVRPGDLGDEVGDDRAVRQVGHQGFLDQDGDRKSLVPTDWCALAWWRLATENLELAALAAGLAFGADAGPGIRHGGRGAVLGGEELLAGVARGDLGVGVGQQRRETGPGAGTGGALDELAAGMNRPPAADTDGKRALRHDGILQCSTNRTDGPTHETREGAKEMNGEHDPSPVAGSCPEVRDQPAGVAKMSGTSTSAGE